MIEVIGETVNGWVAALGGVAVVLTLSAFLRAYHELYVRRMLWKIYEEVKHEDAPVFRDDPAVGRDSERAAEKPE